MCVVSMIYDYGRQIPPYKWEKDWVEDYKKIIEQARKWDEKTGQPDCDDKDKLAWLKKVEDFLHSMEGKNKEERERILREAKEEYEREERRNAKIGKMVPTEVPYSQLPDHLKEYIRERDS